MRLVFQQMYAIHPSAADSDWYPVRVLAWKLSSRTHCLATRVLVTPHHRGIALPALGAALDVGEDKGNGSAPRLDVRIGASTA